MELYGTTSPLPNSIASLHLHNRMLCWPVVSGLTQRKMPDALKSNISWIQLLTWTIHRSANSWRAKAARPGCSSKGTLLGNSFLWRGAIWIFGANVDTFVSQVLCWRLKPFKIINSGSRPLTCVNLQVLRSKVHASLQWTTTGEYLNVLLSQTKTVRSGAQTSGLLKNCFKGPSERNYMAIAK